MQEHRQQIEKLCDDAFESYTRGDHEAAERLWTEAIRLGHAPRAINGISALKYGRGETREAIAMLEELHRAGPMDPMYLGNIGNYYSSLREYDAAQHWWELAAEQGYLESVHNLFMVHMGHGREREALSFAERLAASPDARRAVIAGDSKIALSMSHALVATLEPESAVEQWRELLAGLENAGNIEGKYKAWATFIRALAYAGHLRLAVEELDFAVTDTWKLPARPQRVMSKLLVETQKDIYGTPRRAHP